MTIAPAACTGPRSRRVTIDARAGVWCAVLCFLWIGAAWHPTEAPHAHPTAWHGTDGAERFEPATVQPQGRAVRTGEIQPPAARLIERMHRKDDAGDEALAGVPSIHPAHDVAPRTVAATEAGASTPRHHLSQVLRL